MLDDRSLRGAAIVRAALIKEGNNMSTDETREALTAMVREGKAAGMYADVHGAAGFCTDHGQAALDVDAIRAAHGRTCTFCNGTNKCSAARLLDALAARDAEVERLTGEAQDALWERTRALNERDAARAEVASLRGDGT